MDGILSTSTSEARLAAAPVRAPFTLSESEVGALMAETSFNYKTVRRWLAGKAVHDSTERLLERALKRFGFEKRPVRSRIVDVGDKAA